MVFMVSIALFTVSILFDNILKNRKAREWVLGTGYTVATIAMAIFLIYAFGVATGATGGGNRFVPVEQVKILSITHSAGAGKYFVEVDKGAYKTTIEYGAWDGSPEIRDSTQKTVDSGYGVLDGISWITPWDYHMGHEDIIHFPVSEIKVVP